MSQTNEKRNARLLTYIPPTLRARVEHYARRKDWSLSKTVLKALERLVGP